MAVSQSIFVNPRALAEGSIRLCRVPHEIHCSKCRAGDRHRGLIHQCAVRSWIEEVITNGQHFWAMNSNSQSRDPVGPAQFSGKPFPQSPLASLVSHPPSPSDPRSRPQICLETGFLMPIQQQASALLDPESLDTATVSPSRRRCGSLVPFVPFSLCHNL